MRDVGWFASLTESERADVMAAGRLIQSVEDLEGLDLPAVEIERLRAVIEASGD